jgi:hypothetical protein
MAAVKTLSAAGMNSLVGTYVKEDIETRLR